MTQALRHGDRANSLLPGCTCLCRAAWEELGDMSKEGMLCAPLAPTTAPAVSLCLYTRAVCAMFPCFLLIARVWLPCGRRPRRCNLFFWLVHDGVLQRQWQSLSRRASRIMRLSQSGWRPNSSKSKRSAKYISALCCFVSEPRKRERERERRERWCARALARGALAIMYAAHQCE